MAAYIIRRVTWTVPVVLLVILMTFLLMKQIEADARHDSAKLLKRLDAEARETAVERAKQ